MIQEMEEKVKMIWGILKEAQNRQKVYAYAHKIDKIYKGGKVYLQVRLKNV